MTDTDQQITDNQKTVTLVGHISTPRHKHYEGLQYTFAEIKDSSGELITCVWKDSEGFVLKESERYTLHGEISIENGKRFMRQPDIKLTPEKPAYQPYVPRKSSAKERFKEGSGVIFTALFWIGVVVFGILGSSSSSSSSSNTANTTTSSDSGYSSSLDEPSSDISSIKPSSYDNSDSSDDSSHDYDTSDSYDYDFADYNSSYDDYSSSSYDGYTNTYGNYVPSPTYSGGSSIGGYSPSATCADGTTSYSQSRSGTCSHHGGVSTWY